MKVIICGAGQVGISLMRYLVAHNYTVTVIDHNIKTINLINEHFEAKAILGHASDPLMLQSAGIAEADIIIAVTQSDEINILICTLAHSIYKVPTRIARIRQQIYLDDQLSNLFASAKLNINYVISPEIEIAKAIANNLVIEGAFTVIKFANNQFYLIGVKITTQTPIINTPILHTSGLYPNIDFSIVGIRRNDKMFIVNDQDIIKIGDEVYFLVNTQFVHQVMPIFGYSGQEVSKVVVIGGGNIGLSLATILEENQHCQSLTLIEYQTDRAHIVAQTLNKTTVINGDALESEILSEANVEQADTFIAVTDDDKVNILGSLLAKNLGAKRTMALINRTNFHLLASSLGIDALIFPRIITVSKILQSIREQNVKQVYTLGEKFGEVIEIEAYHSNLIGMSVKEINKPQEIKVVGILRENIAVIPTLKTIIKNADNVIIVISANVSPETKKLFGI